MMDTFESVNDSYVGNIPEESHIDLPGIPTESSKALREV